MKRWGKGERKRENRNQTEREKNENREFIPLNSYWLGIRNAFLLLLLCLRCETIFDYFFTSRKTAFGTPCKTYECRWTMIRFPDVRAMLLLYVLNDVLPLPHSFFLFLPFSRSLSSFLSRSVSSLMIFLFYCMFSINKS